MKLFLKLIAVLISLFSFWGCTAKKGMIPNQPELANERVMEDESSQIKIANEKLNPNKFTLTNETSGRIIWHMSKTSIYKKTNNDWELMDYVTSKATLSVYLEPSSEMTDDILQELNLHAGTYKVVFYFEDMDQKEIIKEVIVDYK